MELQQIQAPVLAHGQQRHERGQQREAEVREHATPVIPFRRRRNDIAGLQIGIVQFRNRYPLQSRFGGIERVVGHIQVHVSELEGILEIAPFHNYKDLLENHA